MEIFTSPICLAIAFYFAEKKAGTRKAKEKVALLSEHLRIAEIGPEAVQKTIKNPAILDFEDGLEYYSALENKCRVIITEDIGDFHFSAIEVLSSEAFFSTHLLAK